MKRIIEEFGTGYLALIAVGGVAAVIISCMRTGGVLNVAVTNFLNRISG